MSSYTFNTVENPSEGDSVSLPYEVGRSTVRLGPSGVEGRSVVIAWVGQGDTAPYILRTTTDTNPDFPEGAVVLGVQEGKNEWQDVRLWYAVPRSLYRGDA